MLVMAYPEDVIDGVMVPKGQVWWTPKFYQEQKSRVKIFTFKVVAEYQTIEETSSSTASYKTKEVNLDITVSKTVKESEKISLYFVGGIPTIDFGDNLKNGIDIIAGDTITWNYTTPKIDNDEATTGLSGSSLIPVYKIDVAATMGFNEVPLWATLTSTGTFTIHPPIDAKIGTYTVYVNLTLQDFGNADISKSTSIKISIVKNDRAWLITLVGTLVTAILTVIISLLLYFALAKLVNTIKVVRKF